MTLTQDDCKLLTGMIEECWHEIPLEGDYIEICVHCGKSYAINRTFTVGNDMVAVKEAIEKMGKWDVFYWWSWHKCQRDGTTYVGDDHFVAWLMHPPRFCKLAARWRRKEKERAI